MSDLPENFFDLLAETGLSISIDPNTAKVAPAPSKARIGGQTQWGAQIVKKVYPKKGQPERADGFSIALALHGLTGEIIKIQGSFGPVNNGDIIEITQGRWADDPGNKWGEVEFMWVNATAVGVVKTREAVIRYLQNLEGVGPGMAKAIVDTLGVECLEKIDDNPNILAQVKAKNGHHFSDEELKVIIRQWPVLAADRVNMLFLDGLGLVGSRAKLICERFRTSTVDEITRNPYVICDIATISFRLADVAAQKLGIKTTDSRRLEAGVEYVLAEAEDDGHVCLTREQAQKRAMEILFRPGAPRPPEKAIYDAIEAAIDAGALWAVTDEGDGIERIYTTEMFVIETRLYKKLEAMLTCAPLEDPKTFSKPLDSFLTDEQWQAVANSFCHRLSILTGGPGTGKTTTLKTVLDEHARRSQYAVCMAPTGKAAKRMQESTGVNASTIHRQLGMDGLESPFGIDDDEESSNVLPENIIDAPLVIIDESSMTDMRVMERVVSHLSDKTRLLLVGDPNQLPAIGAGSVLHDLLESGRVPTTELTKVQRQAAGSLNVLNLNRIKDGADPYWTAAEAESDLRRLATEEGTPLPDDFHVRDDWYFVEAIGEEQALRKTLKLVDRIQEKLGVGPADVLVTAPMRKGKIGVNSLNLALQARQNPQGTIIREGQLRLRVGDRVMNTKNRYGRNADDFDVMNGELGVIVEYNEKIKTVKVDFGFKSLVSYTKEEQKNLIPAYAATTHKLQGSEAPAIIVPLVDENMRMATRQLEYTAFSRAKELCCYVGTKQALRKAIRRDGSQRNTRLDLMVSRVGPRLTARWEMMKEKEEQLAARRRRPLIRQQHKRIAQPATQQNSTAEMTISNNMLSTDDGTVDDNLFLAGE